MVWRKRLRHRAAACRSALGNARAGVGASMTHWTTKQCKVVCEGSKEAPALRTKAQVPWREQDAKKHGCALRSAGRRLGIIARAIPVRPGSLEPSACLQSSRHILRFEVSSSPQYHPRGPDPPDILTPRRLPRRYDNMPGSGRLSGFESLEDAQCPLEVRGVHVGDQAKSVSVRGSAIASSRSEAFTGATGDEDLLPEESLRYRASRR